MLIVMVLADFIVTENSSLEKVYTLDSRSAKINSASLIVRPFRKILGPPDGCTYPSSEISNNKSVCDTPNIVTLTWSPDPNTYQSGARAASVVVKKSSVWSVKIECP